MTFCLLPHDLDFAKSFQKHENLYPTKLRGALALVGTDLAPKRNIWLREGV